MAAAGSEEVESKFNIFNRKPNVLKKNQEKLKSGTYTTYEILYINSATRIGNIYDVDLGNTYPNISQILFDDFYMPYLTNYGYSRTEPLSPSPDHASYEKPSVYSQFINGDLLYILILDDSNIKTVKYNIKNNISPVYKDYTSAESNIVSRTVVFNSPLTLSRLSILIRTPVQFIQLPKSTLDNIRIKNNIYNNLYFYNDATGSNNIPEIVSGDKIFISILEDIGNINLSRHISEYIQTVKVINQIVYLDPMLDLTPYLINGVFDYRVELYMPKNDLQIPVQITYTLP